MKFNYVFLLSAFVLLLCAGQSEGGFLKKIGKKIEGAGQRVRDAAYQALPLAQGAASIYSATRG
ncbi:cecropin-1-like [Hermetia illucens]|uniref:cecropin-1-like n=1 Tax=Hermetia illucens TaxID=343691 RepID=UPI0018CC51A4|nr:cecropin-1-like [Hermetia illucens]